MVVNSINRLKEMLSVRVQHSLREGNTLADFFANLFFHFASNYEYKSFQDVPSSGKKIINLDKYKTPYMRIQKIGSTIFSN